MSRCYYFACDIVLPDQRNPKVKWLSINEALDLGIDIDLSLFNDNVDRDKLNTILFCNDEKDLDYPNIYSVSREILNNDITTLKRFGAVLEWKYSEPTVDVVLDYIKSQLKSASEIELWSVWLGSNVNSTNSNILQCHVDNLTIEKLGEFYNSDLDSYCLTVVR